MAALDPLTIAALGLGFLAYATVIGNPVRRLLLSPDVFEGQRPNLPIRWVTSVMTGLAVIPLVYLTLGLVPGWAGPGPAWGLLLSTLVWNVVLQGPDETVFFDFARNGGSSEGRSACTTARSSSSSWSS